jgi:hypothetical protein
MIRPSRVECHANTEFRGAVSDSSLAEMQRPGVPLPAGEGRRGGMEAAVENGRGLISEERRG